MHILLGTFMPAVSATGKLMTPAGVDDGMEWKVQMWMHCEYS